MSRLHACDLQIFIHTSFNSLQLVFDIKVNCPVIKLLVMYHEIMKHAVPTYVSAFKKMSCSFMRSTTRLSYIIPCASIEFTRQVKLLNFILIKVVNYSFSVKNLNLIIQSGKILLHVSKGKCGLVQMILLLVVDTVALKNKNKLYSGRKFKRRFKTS